MTDDTHEFTTESNPGEQAFESTVNDAVAFFKAAFDAEENGYGARMDGRASDPLGPVILGLAFIVVAPALIGLTTPLWQGVSAIILLGLVSLIALWIVSRASGRLAAAGGGDD